MRTTTTTFIYNKWKYLLYNTKDYNDSRVLDINDQLKLRTESIAEVFEEYRSEHHNIGAISGHSIINIEDLRTIKLPKVGKVNGSDDVILKWERTVTVI